MSKPFKLSATLYGHSLDVRSVYTTQNNFIVSGSRDKSAKLWMPNEINTGYRDAASYTGQKNFVASVLYIEQNKDFSTGLVLTGGNDHKILIYNSHEPFPSMTITEHTNVVCHLSKAQELNTFLSSSWDGTAKLWNLKNPSKALVTYLGHTASVWSAVQLHNGNVVTASADKTIGIFAKEGHRINIIQAHNDCVRDILDLSDLNCFASVSNDAAIKMWTYAGENVGTYYGHTNYIYCIARNVAGGTNCFVTSDEDRTVRYWQEGVNTETIHLPAQSIWSVACLSNGDIVTGSSDGLVRIFTQDENRYASEEDLRNFEEAVSAMIKQSMQEIGGIKVSDLPGPESLLEPGSKDGQLKMIREAGVVVAYNWAAEGESGHWEKVGEVLGESDPNAQNKTTFEGKSYDYVFSVDVEDGKPALKLPYNLGDDPYVAAHNFLQKHMLPAEYLDQVVNFILTNSKQEQSTSRNSGYVDPYTGASRYTPRSENNTTVSQASRNFDPFTGGSSYTTGNPSFSSVSSSSSFFPLIHYKSFEQGNPKIIFEKLREFNGKVPSNQTVNEGLLSEIVKLGLGATHKMEVLDTLFNMLNWSDDLVFPVIDVLRMAVRYQEISNAIVERDHGIIVDILKYYLTQECQVVNSTVVALRALCNMFLHKKGEELIFQCRVSLIEIVSGLSLGNKNVQVALATFLLNLTVLCKKQVDELGLKLLTSVLPDMILHMNDPEAQFRSLVALGTLISNENSDLQKIDVSTMIRDNSIFINNMQQLARSGINSDVEYKRNTCVDQVLAKLGRKD